VFEILGAVAGIVLVDLVLSGDNALVIGAAAAGLPRKQRWFAIVLGGGGAIVLRLVLVVIATFLLRLPLIQAFGGLLLLFIAIRLLAARQEKQPAGAGEPATQQVQAQEHGENTNVSSPALPVQTPAASSLIAALLTILVADLTMSLDNVLAVGALAHGNLPLLAVGILLSIVILMLGSALVAELIGRFSWLLDVAALVLAWTGANMVLSDLRLGPWLDRYPWTQLVIPAIAFAVVLAADVLLRLHEDAACRVERPGL
jgi:YjbE family integral membrane protein